MRLKPLLLIVLISFAAAPTLAQESTPDRRPVQKDPNAATVFAILLPGGGHLYAGETTKGLVMLGVAATAPVIGFIADRASDSGEETFRTLGSLVSAGVWIYSLVDAAPTARRANARNGYAVNVSPAVIGETPALAMQVVW